MSKAASLLTLPKPPEPGPPSECWFCCSLYVLGQLPDLSELAFLTYKAVIISAAWGVGKVNCGGFVDQLILHKQSTHTLCRFPKRNLLLSSQVGCWADWILAQALDRNYQWPVVLKLHLFTSEKSLRAGGEHWHLAFDACWLTSVCPSGFTCFSFAVKHSSSHKIP